MVKVTPAAKYEQLCQDYRSLNSFFWQTPLIVMTLTGGLWFSVANFELSETARRGLLVFAAIADVLMMLALVRLRSVMEGVYGQIRELDDRPAVGRHNRILKIFSALMLIAAVGSAFASVDPSGVFKKSAPASVRAAQDSTKAPIPAPQAGAK